VGLVQNKVLREAGLNRPLKKHLGMECLSTDLEQNADMKTRCSPSHQFTQTSCDAITL